MAEGTPKSNGRGLFFWVCVILIQINYSAAELDLGVCGKKMFNCQCGLPPKSYIFQIPIKECSTFFKWHHSCSPCRDEKEEDTCSPYKNCAECQEGANKCISCPPGKYGIWCNEDCNCQNGGKCDQSDGSCTCLPTHVGRFCEIRHFTGCNPPAAIPNVIWGGTSYLVGDVVTASCAEGYFLLGNKTQVCTSQGEWSSVPPTCEISCPLPKISGHVQVVLNPGLTSKLVDADGKEVVKEIGFMCEPGYNMDGPLRTRCQPTGKWDQDPPKCMPKLLCPPLGNVTNGRVDISGAMEDALVPGTQLKVICKNSHFLDGPGAISCMPTGKWSQALPRCLKVFGCPPPSTIKNGKVEITKAVGTAAKPLVGIRSRIGIPQGVGARGVVLKDSATPQPPPGFSNVNSKALYSCKSIYYRLIGPSSRLCLPNGKWSGREPTCDTSCGKAGLDSKRPSIINGSVSALGRWPWQAGISLRDDNSPAFSLKCGGSLISENLVLTAAHCVNIRSSSKTQSLKNIRIYLGKHSRFDELDDTEVAVVGVESIVIHPNFHPRSLDSDVALVKLNRLVEFTHRISPVCLPQTIGRVWKDDLPQNLTGTVIGWGIAEDGFASDELKEAVLPVVPREKCEEDYRGVNISVTLTTNMFCAGLEEGGLGTCQGDSGGPFMVSSGLGQDTIWTQEGIVSFGGSKKCAAEKEYSGFLKVYNFVDWISQFM